MVGMMQSPTPNATQIEPRPTLPPSGSSIDINLPLRQVSDLHNTTSRIRLLAKFTFGRFAILSAASRVLSLD
jgi:hypothetical protein